MNPLILFSFIQINLFFIFKYDILFPYVFSLFNLNFSLSSLNSYFLFFVIFSFHVFFIYLYNCYFIYKYINNYHANYLLKATNKYDIEEHESERIIKRNGFDEEIDNLDNLIKTRNDGNKGVFGPDDAIWIVARESCCFMGGGRAVLLQFAHPYVVSGVVQHSNVARDVQKRFYNTFDAVFKMTFGELKEAEKSANIVRKIHDRINGKIESESFPFSEDHLYTAHHEGGLIWVFSTLVETALFFFEMMVRNLSYEEKDGVYQNQKQFARYFGISLSSLPEDYKGFEQYVANMWTGDIITVNPTARVAANDLFNPTTFVAKYAMKWSKLATHCILPPSVLDGYQKKLSLFDKLNVYSGFAVLRMIYKVLPPELRYLTAYFRAEERTTNIKRNKFLIKFANAFGHWLSHDILMNPSMNQKK